MNCRLDVRLSELNFARKTTYSLGGSLIIRRQWHTRLLQIRKRCLKAKCSMEHCTGNIARVVIYHVIMHPISDISTPFLVIPLFLVRQ